jgi:restriction system protein
MLLINWLKLALSEQDIEHTVQGLRGIVHLRSICLALVRTVLLSYPWEQRQDLVPLFDPSCSYQISDMVAFPQVDHQGLRPDAWRLGVVKIAINAENPAQGQFQVVTFEIAGDKKVLGAGIRVAQPPSLHFPPEDDESLDWVVSDLTDAYYSSISGVVKSAIQEGRMRGRLSGDQILFETDQPLVGEDETYYLVEFFTELILQRPWLTTEEIVTRLRSLGCLEEASDEIAAFAIEQALVDLGYCNLGGKQWTTSDLFEQLDREVSCRMQVPVIRSRLALKLGLDEGQELLDYEQTELDGQGMNTLVELGDEAAGEASPEVEWMPSAAPLAMPVLTYFHIMQSFFPLSRQLARAFDPRHDLQLVHVQLVEGEAVPFLVNRVERTFKALEAGSVLHRFQNLGIPGGTHLWLEYQGGTKYRIAPRPLPAPIPVKCKLAFMEAGKLHIEEALIDMRFEGNPHLFKAEWRFEDPQALFEEARQGGLSIFDAMVEAFRQLSRLHPEGLVHHSDLFNAVFFQHRMCSPRSVVTELYTRPCFVPTGEGYFHLDLSQGIRRRISKSVPVATGWHKPLGVEESELWQQISTGIPCQLQTLGEGSPFEIVSVSPRMVRLVTSTGETRTLQRKELEEAWNRLVACGQLPRTVIRDEISKFSSSFVVAILAALPGVESKSGPIRLFYASSAIPSPEIAPTPQIQLPLPLPPAGVAFSSAPEPSTLVPEKTHRGQFIASGLIPPGPLFEKPKSEPSTINYLEPESTLNEPAPLKLPATPPLVEPLTSPQPDTRVRGRGSRKDQAELLSKTLFSPHFLDNRMGDHIMSNLDVLTDEEIVIMEGRARTINLQTAGAVSNIAMTLATEMIFDQSEPSRVEILMDKEVNVNTQEAFDTLINRLSAALEAEKSTVVQTASKGQFSSVVAAGKRCEEIQSQIQNLEALKGKWNGLVGETGVVQTDRKQKARNERLQHGLKTPERAYRLPILRSLEEMGGSGPVNDVLTRTRQKMNSILNSYDLTLLKDGHTPRWRNAAQWERNNMRDAGLIKKDSPSGIWEITEAGRNWLREHQE